MAAEGHRTAHEPDPEGVFESLPGTDRIQRLLTEEMGPEMATAYAQTRLAQERWARRHHPDEGLRERKKRLTRQQISDVATTLFIVRGFDRVTVAQVAEIVGVSEKTVYNYFPTKESLVFDQADEASERLASALRERSGSESPTRVIMRELAEQNRDLEELPDESHMLLPLFAEMIAGTPALRAAWLELQDRLAELVTAELARHAEIDPQEPEPTIAARAIVGLIELAFQSRIRHVEDGLRGVALAEAIEEDLERAARLLDTGLWSFNLLTHGARTRSQLREAALATEQARKQVMDALRQARNAWQELRGEAREEARAHRDQVRRTAGERAAAVREEAGLSRGRAKRSAKEQVAAAHQEAKRAAKAQAMAVHDEAKRAAKDRAAAAHEEAKRAAKQQAIAAREEVKRVAREQAAAIREEAKRAAKQQIAVARGERRPQRQTDPRSYEQFRQAMAARHEAIRARQSQPAGDMEAPDPEQDDA